MRLQNETDCVARRDEEQQVCRACARQVLRVAARPWFLVCSTRTGIARGVGVARVPAPVGRAVVHEQYVQVLVVLGEDAVEALGEVALHVVHRHHDRDQRGGGLLARRCFGVRAEGSVTPSC